MTINEVHYDEVVNETLQTRFGIATLADDGSGTFSVNYNVDGGTYYYIW